MAHRLEHLLLIIDQAYVRRSWHGTNLRGSIRRVGAEEAAWRPGPRRHNIWEIVVHGAYWKYVVWRRLTGSPRGSFPLKGSDWFTRPVSDPGIEIEKAWEEDVKLLDRMHLMLREAVAAVNEKELFRTSKGSEQTNFFLLSGIAAHDIYHAGQIQLLKRIWAGK